MGDFRAIIHLKGGSKRTSTNPYGSTTIMRPANDSQHAHDLIWQFIEERDATGGHVENYVDGIGWVVHEPE